jgi:predicted enzyme related to lactoylglutathione lyase
MAENRVVHFEIPANEPEKLAKFYADLFGWKIDKIPVPGFDYWTCQTGDGPGINGGIMKRAVPQQCLTNYIKVEQLDRFVEKAKSLGANVVVPRSPVKGMGWFAVALDPENNPVGFWQDDKNAG